MLTYLEYKESDIITWGEVYLCLKNFFDNILTNHTIKEKNETNYKECVYYKNSLQIFSFGVRSPEKVFQLTIRFILTSKLPAPDLDLINYLSTTFKTKEIENPIWANTYHFVLSKTNINTIFNLDASVFLTTKRFDL